jgi:hypothetical protein
VSDATGNHLSCFKCHKDGRAAHELMPYLNPDVHSQQKHVWAHPLCMPIPEVDFANYSDMQR